jgi:alanine racemase
MMDTPSAPLVLSLDSGALRHNWRWMAAQSGEAACGAAVKANGYGLGAVAVVQHLLAEGCRDFFVATWAEAQEIRPYTGDAAISVLHGVREDDMAIAMALGARPVLNTPDQIARWRDAGGGPCDIMIDTGMNRLGLDPNTVTRDLFEGLTVETVMSHLACADEDHHLTAVQRMIFTQLARKVGAQRLSLANSAGILLGSDYAFDLTRPGLALYGGVPRPEAVDHIRQVVRPRAQILQRRTIRGGESVGYGATYVADRQREAAILNIGYADGYLRGFSGTGHALADDGAVLPLLGRVSMDLVVIDVTERPSLGEGDWLEIGYDLSEASAASGLSQYELLTGLGRRFDRQWTD